MNSSRHLITVILHTTLISVLLALPVSAQDEWDGEEDFLEIGTNIVRGIWVTRWEYRHPEDVTSLLSRAARYGMTDVFFQIRGRGDAFYRSSLEPWGEELTGRLGGDPGWDPLDVAIREAHTRGLRLHAWINTFPIWSGTTPPPVTQPEHVYLKHPEWIMANRVGSTQRLGNRFGYISASPANPEVQAHIQAVVMDIVANYDVDGIHFDYIRLPDHDYSYDAVSRGRYLRESLSMSYMEFQAGEITGMLERITSSARAIKPGLIMTAAIVNRYNRAVGIFAQDPVAWLDRGALDYVIPMMYTPYPAEFVDMMNGYREVLPADRIAAGINLGEMPDDPRAVAAQVHESLMAGIKGHVLFSMENVDDLDRLASRYENLYSYLEVLSDADFAGVVRALPVPTTETTVETPVNISQLLPALVKTAIMLAFVL
jgi:uncharacterized lipoprotein YddW (UPF0748 family)